jgi:hypothetical protein
MKTPRNNETKASEIGIGDFVRSSMFSEVYKANKEFWFGYVLNVHKEGYYTIQWSNLVQSQHWKYEVYKVYDISIDRTYSLNDLINGDVICANNGDTKTFTSVLKAAFPSHSIVDKYQNEQYVIYSKEQDNIFPCHKSYLQFIPHQSCGAFKINTKKLK